MKDFIQPILDYKAGLWNTWSGILVDFANPTGEMISLNDIAKSLSNICRFNGHVTDSYTVAQHTLLVWHLAPTELKRAALLHDAAEAYTGDCTKPFKHMLGEVYKSVEEKFERVIFEKYEVPYELLKEVKPYDNLALEIEDNYFRYGNLDFISKFYDINEEINFETPYKQLLTLLRSEFMQAEISYSTKNK